jgi:hypothetical protein
MREPPKYMKAPGDNRVYFTIYGGEDETRKGCLRDDQPSPNLDLQIRRRRFDLGFEAWFNVVDFGFHALDPRGEKASTMFRGRALSALSAAHRRARQKLFTSSSST